MRRNLRRVGSSKDKYKTAIRVYFIFSIVVGVLGIAAYLNFRENRAKQLIDTKRELEELQENELRIKSYKLDILPKEEDVAAGVATEFEVRLFDENDQLATATRDLTISIRPDPTTRTYSYVGEKGKYLYVPKGSANVTVKYSETKAGKYKLAFSADGFVGETVEITVNPAAATSLTIKAPSSADRALMSDGVTLEAVASDKYKNKITDGYRWTVNKNGEGEDPAGESSTITYSDESASACDTYVFKAILSGKTVTQTIQVTNPGGNC